MNEAMQPHIDEERELVTDNKFIDQVGERFLPGYNDPMRQRVEDAFIEYDESVQVLLAGDVPPRLREPMLHRLGQQTRGLYLAIGKYDANEIFANGIGRQRREFVFQLENEHGELADLPDGKKIHELMPADLGSVRMVYRWDPDDAREAYPYNVGAI